MKEQEELIISPQKGFQERFVESNVDIVFGGGAAGVGKTSAAVLSIAYSINNPLYRALYIRKNLGELKGGGSMLEEFAKLYPSQLIKKITTSDNPEVEFRSGARVVMTHLADESVDNITERIKGWQYDLIYLDELTAYEFSTFTHLMTRNRGSSGEAGKMRATTNPLKSSWVRQFIDWYIDDDGFLDPERDGVVRYFYYMGGGIEGVVWGDTKHEVYMKCKSTIDRYLKNANLTYLSPYNLIKSFTFYGGKLGDNKIKMKQDPNYAGSIAMAGGSQAEMLLGGNWNVDIESEEVSTISRNAISNIFNNDPQIISDKRYITADIALEGGDNMVVIVWFDFHIKDIIVLSSPITSPEAINAIQTIQDKYDIGNSNVIYDSIGAGSFLSGFITGARRYNSGFSVSKAGKGSFENARAECVYKLKEMLEADAISAESYLAERPYKHKQDKDKQPRTIQQQLMFESKAFIPIKSAVGKIKMPTKKEMQKILGKNRSPDILDAIIMRMWVDLRYVPQGAKPQGDRYMKGKENENHVNIYDFFNSW